MSELHFVFDTIASRQLLLAVVKGTKKAPLLPIPIVL
jgi:hypothetical protein